MLITFPRLATTKRTIPTIDRTSNLPRTIGHQLQQRIPNHPPTKPTRPIPLTMARLRWATCRRDQNLLIPLIPITSPLANTLHYHRRRRLLLVPPDRKHPLHIPPKAVPVAYPKAEACKSPWTRQGHGHNWPKITPRQSQRKASTASTAKAGSRRTAC